MMASASPAVSSKAVIASVLAEEDLSEEQIHQLLQQAETRLKEKSEATPIIKQSTKSLPKLNPGNISEPYIRSKGGICRVDSSCLLDKDVQNLADQPRKVTIAAVEKKKLAEVRY